MAFTRLTTSASMNVGIIRNRGLEDISNFNDTVHFIINPLQTIKIGDKVSFSYQGVPCEGEIAQILYPEGNIIVNTIREGNSTAIPAMEQVPVYKVRVFSCSDYSIFPEGSGTECVIQASDIVRLQPLGWSP